MRFLLVALRNLVALVLLVLALPVRLFRRRARPEYVRFRLKADPPYRALPRWRSLFRREEAATVRSLYELGKQLRSLGGDPSVKGIVIELEDFRGAAAKRDAVAGLLEALRARGKEVIGYAISADTSAYELLLCCDRIVLSPAGRLDLIGFSAEATALGQGLRRMGIAAQFVRRGEHKTAPELFTHDEVSEIQKKTLEMILDERYQELISLLQKGRRLTAEEAKARVDEGPFSAKRAKERGLVDALVSEADLGTFLAPAEATKNRDGVPEVRIDSFAGYARTLCLPPFYFSPWRRRARLSVVPIAGMIVHGRGGGAPMGPAICGSEQVARSLRFAARDPRTRAVLLYVSSPGGSALGSELILEEVRRVAKKKPVLAYFDRVAASGGYMAALGANEIWSAPLAIVGSIGVFAGKFDLSKLFERFGARRAIVSRGQNASIFTSSRPFTEAERAALEADVEETYQAFLEHVAAARRQAKEEIHAKAQGRIYSGRGAQKAGLVDKVGLFEEAGRRALQLAGKEVEDFDVILHGAPPRRLRWLRLLQQTAATHLYALWYPWVTVK
ncbi:MAG: signal peptide peptidase SppA [Myxococcota bacterium]